MRDRPVIWTGLAVFLILVTFPLWRNQATGATAKGPQPVLPKTEKQCVLPLEQMRDSHMRLLLDWRDDAIRRGRREYTAPDGRRFQVSLTNTCLRQCHGAKTDFCDRCHNYAAVALPCWDCHQDVPHGAPAAAVAEVSR